MTDDDGVIDSYTAEFEGIQRERLEQMASHIRGLLPPEALEKLSWGMPTFTLAGSNLVHFAAGKHHTGFYPGPSGVEHVTDQLRERGLKFSKGAIQFPLAQPLPLDIVTRVVQFRIDQERTRRAGGGAGGT